MPSLVDLDPQILEVFSNEIKDVVEQYPQLKESLQSNPMLVSATDAGDEYIASTNFMFHRSISINTSYTNRADRLTGLISKHQRTGYFMPATNLEKYAISHEMGHVIHDFIWQQQKTTPEKMHNDIIRIAQRVTELKTTKDLGARHLSGYGRENYDEAFAEMFANMRCGKPNLLGRAMKEYLRRVFK